MLFNEEYYDMYPVGRKLLYRGRPATVVKREDRDCYYNGAMLIKFNEPNNVYAHDANGFFSEQIGRWIEKDDFERGNIEFCVQIEPVGIEELI